MGGSKGGGGREGIHSIDVNKHTVEKLPSFFVQVDTLD